MNKFTGKGESIENQVELYKQYIRTYYPNCKDGNILKYEDQGFGELNSCVLCSPRRDLGEFLFYGGGASGRSKPFSRQTVRKSVRKLA